MRARRALANWWALATSRRLAACAVFSPTREEATRITGETESGAMLARFRTLGGRVLALRRGPDGADVWDLRAGRGVHVPAVRTAVADVVGAGNAFCGALLARLDGAAHHIPTVLMGEFNQWSDRGALSEFAFHHHRLVKTPPSFHSTRPVARLDRIIVSHDIMVENSGAHISDLSKRASDHLPLWATLKHA